MPNLWQIAAGETARDYRQLFLDHDLALIGPGTPGNAQTTNVYRSTRGLYGSIQSFADDPQPGDVVLLRLYRDVHAIGFVPEESKGGYAWDDRFDDVLGWDLQHSRRIQWEPELLSSFPELRGVFGAQKQQPTFTGVNIVPQSTVNALAASYKPRKLRPLPEVGPILGPEQLGIELFSAGLANDVVDHVLQTLAQIKRLANWYQSDHAGDRPTEHEVVGHILLPLLRSLGWSEQLLGVEWKRMDVAIFDRVPTDEKSCVVCCEAKSLGSSLTAAFEQAKAYIDDLKLKRCNLIVAADGARVVTYRRLEGEWLPQPAGYLNCIAPRAKHLLPVGASSVRTIVSLMPGRIASP